MRIGVDIDGVLADFVSSFLSLVIEVTGKNLFHPNDDKDPPTWNWAKTRGYTDTELKSAGTVIAHSHDFWMNLAEDPGCRTLRLCILDLMRYHDIYFVTDRPGADAKWQTEQWLILHLGIERPTVLISKYKGLVARALELDCYIDDNLDSVNSVVMHTAPEELRNTWLAPPMCRTYLLNRSYNRDGLCDSRVMRVDTVGQFLDKELHNL